MNGAQPDAGSLGELTSRQLESGLRECSTRRLDESLRIACGVGTNTLVDHDTHPKRYPVHGDPFRVSVIDVDHVDPFEDRPIHVGVLGANPDRGWAARAHIPAILDSPDFRLSAVATTRAESAEAARERFGADHAFTSASSLAAHPGVDLVVVTVKVPAHLELVTAAIEAGKHVYCEWPLGRTAAEAQTMQTAAHRAGVRTFTGLQARYDPAVEQARASIAAGSIGVVQSATVYSSRDKGATVAVPAWTAYTYADDQGAGLVDVLGGHALDLVQHLLGPIADITTRTALRSPVHVVEETGQPIDVTAADHLMAIATLTSGAVVTLHLHDGETAHPRTRIEIAGTEGDLALVSRQGAEPQAAQLQISPFEVHHATSRTQGWNPLAVPAPRTTSLPTQAANISRLYANIANDLRHGSRTAPDFDDAVRLHRLL